MSLKVSVSEQHTGRKALYHTHRLCPTPDSIKVLASMQSPEYGHRPWIVGVHPSEPHNARVGVAHQYLADIVDAVVCWEETC